MLIAVSGAGVNNLGCTVTKRHGTKSSPKRGREKGTAAERQNRFGSLKQVIQMHWF